MHSRNKPLADDVDLTLLARQTSGLTGADLANICNEAAIFAAPPRARRRSTMRDFDAALERVVAGMQSRRALTDHEKRVVAYHEAGHALCGELLPSVDRVHRISIVPRGRALGYTLNLPEEDRYLKTREELIDFMTMLLGGRAAEQLVFGSVTTGAVRRSQARRRDRAVDGPRVRDGHRRDLAARAATTAPRRPPAASATRRSASSPTRRSARRSRSSTRTARSSTSWRRRCSPTRCSSARTSSGSWATLPSAAPRRIGELSDRGGDRDASPQSHRRGASSAGPVGLGAVSQSSAGYAPARMLSTIDHVGVAVEDIDSALALYRDVLGMPLVHRETVTEQGVDAALLDVGDSHVELLQPLGPETAVGKFLARRGPGLHHVAYRVESTSRTR